MAEHTLLYRAGSSGLTHLGIPDNSTPYWYCSCGDWRINRKPNGSPLRETASRHHRTHIKAAQ